MNWTDFYAEFADKLRICAEDRTALLGKIRSVYDSIEMELPPLDAEGQLTDTDPFTIFALFSRGMPGEDRKKLLDALAAAFEVTAPVPEDLTGVALLSSQHAVFYAPAGERDEADIGNLWKLFIAALDLADGRNDETQAAFIQAYDTVLKQRGIRWNITMGLSWVRPLSFINLDHRNRRYLGAETRLNDPLENVPDGEAYLKLLDSARENLENWGCTSFPDLTAHAWEEWKAVRAEERRKHQEERAASRPLPRTAPANPAAREAEPRVWLFALGQNAASWEKFRDEGVISLGWDELGDLSVYPTQAALRQKMQEVVDPNRSFTQAARIIWQFVHEMKTGETVYVKRGMNTVLGHGIVRSDLIYDSQASFPNSRRVEWLDVGEWAYPPQRNPVKALTDISAYGPLRSSLALLFQKGPLPEPEPASDAPAQAAAYTEDDFLKDVFMRPEQLTTLLELLQTRKNLILQGAVGTGKTYTALRLAWVLTGQRDSERVLSVSFHPGCTYSDFMVDFIPAAGGGYRRRNGLFYSFCRKAQQDPDHDYCFLIDEMNQCDLRTVFGEVITLLESESRNRTIHLMRSGESFSLPANLHIIGMVRTVDHTPLELSILRQFAVYDMVPAFDSDGFRTYQTEKRNRKFDRLILTTERMNEEIANEETLGEEYRIGHSIFCTSADITDRWLDRVVNHELIPQLNLIWAGKPSRARYWEQSLRRAIR